MSSAQWWHGLDDGEVVVAGIAGRFPDCDNAAQFADRLFAAADLLSDDERRWPGGYRGLPRRHGQLNDLTRFDAGLFGVPPAHVPTTDPHVRLLLEVAHEAMLDAGLDPAELRGTRTGVFVGVSSSAAAMVDALVMAPDATGPSLLTGTMRAMFANRL